MPYAIHVEGIEADLFGHIRDIPDKADDMRYSNLMDERLREIT
jgi:hypothetical protein